MSAYVISTNLETSSFRNARCFLLSVLWLLEIFEIHMHKIICDHVKVRTNNKKYEIIYAYICECLDFMF